jgi:ABC-type nitrate/sulfonate/bicarbonate transport system substrate-binding protein
MHQRERNVMMERWGAVLAIVFTVSLGAIAASPAAAQQLVPFRIGMQLPAIFEYLYVNYAIESGILKKEGIEGKITGFNAGLTATRSGRQSRRCMRWITSSASAIAHGSPARTVYSVNADNTYVIVTRDTIAKPEDLREKKWAITQMGAISQTYAALWLNKKGLPGHGGLAPHRRHRRARARRHRQSSRCSAVDGW